VVAKPADGLKPVAQEERIQQQVSSATVAKSASTADTVLAGAVKQAAPASGDLLGDGDRSEPDQRLVQINQIPPHQYKAENAASTGNTTTAPVSGSPSALSEHVVRQVSEHLADRGIKAGSEQITLRLNPENLGELKLNMRMDENQRLSIEIVTENRMVRDALLQHSDSLKDSLARQNIKMDSFDVSTGANSGGNAGRGQSQNEWRELARNRQSLQWQQTGGYNVPDVVVAEKLAYNQHTQYGMLDIHY
jgi:flagellar hook-length control protein FliK